MSMLDALFGPLAGAIERTIPAAPRRETARPDAMSEQRKQDIEMLRTQLSAIIAEAQSTDPWTRRARPSFLYVMYAMILVSIPVGVLAALQPQMAQNFAAGMTAYLAAIPDAMWLLFGTGYLGYTAARSWAKARGFER